jgi:hypothetical protein
MLIKLSYPVKSSLLLDEHWPITMGDIRFEWHVKDALYRRYQHLPPFTAPTFLLP